MFRFYFPGAIASKQIETADPEFINRVVHVLRMKEGDEMGLFNDAGEEYLATLSAVDKKSLTMAVGERIKRESEAAIRLVLHPALIKKNHFEWMLQKCTEVGVAEFAPVAAARSIVHGEPGEAAQERLHKIIVEAVEQSERIKIPELRPAESLAAMLKNIPKSDTIYVAAERSGKPNIEQVRSAIAGRADASTAVHLFIGPEGGWTPEELTALAERGAEKISLGDRILRAETAAVAFSALLIYI